MKLLNFLKTGLAVSVAVSLMSACTVSEPDINKDSTPGGKLQSISILGTNFIVMKYDNAGRLTDIQDWLGGTKLQISYNPLIIVCEEANSSYDGEEWNVYTQYIDIYEDITLNSDGYITSMKTREQSLDWSGDVKNEDISYQRLEYDADGHLVRSYDIEDGPDSGIHYEWNSGLLNRIVVGGGDDIERVFTYEYSQYSNPTFQWTPLWDDLGLYRLTGFFGKAPSRFVSKVTQTNSWGDIEEASFGYTLNSAGQISKMWFRDYDNESMSFNFQYGF